MSSGADVALRIELDPPRAPRPRRRGRSRRSRLTTDAEEPRTPKTRFRPPRAVLQLTSRAESSLVVDAADLYTLPGGRGVPLRRRRGDGPAACAAPGRSCLGTARAAAPRAGAHRPRSRRRPAVPSCCPTAPRSCKGTGLAVLWPSEILADGIELRASVVPAPGVVVEAGFSLDTLVEFRWQATLNGELLSEEEIDQLAEAKRGLVRLRGRWVAADPASSSACRAPPSAAADGGRGARRAARRHRRPRRRSRSRGRRGAAGGAGRPSRARLTGAPDRPSLACHPGLASDVELGPTSSAA